MTKVYTSPKTHKQENPGRPVVNVNLMSSHTKNLSKFVDHYLQPHLQNLPLYVRDTPEFIIKVRHIQEDARDTILVSMDMKFLYISIPNHDGIETVKEKLNA